MGNANGGVFLREGVWRWWGRMGERGERGGQEVDGDGEPESADGNPLAKSFYGSVDGVRGWVSQLGGDRLMHSAGVR